MAARQTSGKPKATPARGPHPAEWVIGGISAILVITLVAYLAYRGSTADGRPPEFSVNVETIERVGQRFHINVSVTNPGDATAAGVIVRASLGEAGEVIETGEIEFDYLPAGSMRRGAFVFARDPAAPRELELSIMGYTDP
jgi:uncharacterized protein (TIGR02588 family)